MPKEVIMVGKGLTYNEAVKKAVPKAKHDHRGATYNPKTGKVTLV